MQQEENEEDQRPITTEFKHLPFHLLSEFLQPLELLACMYLNKATRKVAARALNNNNINNNNNPAIALQRQMFETWLDNPTVSPLNGKMCVGSEETMDNCAGPLRLPIIKKLGSKLKKNFVILQYDRSYQHETSVVAIVNDDGGLAAIYQFRSEERYELLESREINSSFDVIFPGSWKPLEWEPMFGFFEVAAVMPGHALFELFYGILSPTETAFVLMHSMSSDTRVIVLFGGSIFNRYHDVLVDVIEDRWGSDIDFGDHFFYAVLEWRDKICGVTYEADKTIVAANDG